MPSYKYRGSVCKEHFKFFSMKMLSKEDDSRHNVPCACETEGCVQSRIMSKPAQPMGFKTWAGDWYKKTYGHEIGERDSAYASEQAELDQQIRDHLKEKDEC